MNPAISEQISDLPHMNRAQLLSLWATNFNTTTPTTATPGVDGDDPGVPDSGAGVRRSVP